MSKTCIPNTLREELYYRGASYTALVARGNNQGGGIESIVPSLTCSLIYSIYSFILHLFLKYLLSISYVPGTMLDTEITGIRPI